MGRCEVVHVLSRKATIMQAISEPVSEASSKATAPDETLRENLSPNTNKYSFSRTHKAHNEFGIDSLQRLQSH